MNTDPTANAEQIAPRTVDIETAAKNVAALFEGSENIQEEREVQYTPEPQPVQPLIETQPYVVQEAVVLPFARNQDALIRETPVWIKIRSYREQALNELAA